MVGRSNKPFPAGDIDQRSAAEQWRRLADGYPGAGPSSRPQPARAERAVALAEPAEVSRIRSDLPLYLAVGDADPVNGGLTLLHPLVQRYRQAGLTDITLHVYPSARHEIFNETNRDEVVADLLTWALPALRTREYGV
jgi:alpha-beta hydrolase superfamily lysophospholipase